MQHQPKYLGVRTTAPIEDLDTIPAAAGLHTVTLECHEVTALCPITGQPDFYTVRIEYRPQELCIESKSLKLYLWHFRDQGIFCEHLAPAICNKVVETVKPKHCKVSVAQSVRGGITIEASAIHEGGQ
jgi:7-cyano-7-deazaguanine reductase